MFTLNCKGKLIIIETPVVMGIINATPDSFYEGHLRSSIAEIVALAGKMISDGAAILDIGGQSTKPGSQRVSAAIEAERVLPLVDAIRIAFPEILISVDTYHSAVAKSAVEAGADIINDISAGDMDENMLATVAAMNVPFVCMHMKGRPETMQETPGYDDVVKEVLDFFIRKTDECKRAGIKDIIIDPGFGFGKNIRHNFALLQQLSAFSILGCPVMAGLSRKSTIYKTLQVGPAEALNGTTVLNTLAIQNGASILRVHDVKEAKEVITLMQAYKKPLPC